MRSITIEASKREVTGSQTAAELRREGNVPFVIYGGDNVIHCYAPVTSMKDLIYSPSFITVNIKVDGNEYHCIPKEMQFHPITDDVLHMDFLILQPGKPVIAEIPVQLEGRAKGVTAGGRLIQQVRKLKVKATSENLNEYFTVDVTDLGMNKSIKIKELKGKVEGIEILHPDSVPVASVMTPRLLKTAAEIAEEEAEEAEEGAVAEGEEGAEGTEAKETADEANA